MENIMHTLIAHIEQSIGYIIFIYIEIYMYINVRVRAIIGHMTKN